MKMWTLLAVVFQTKLEFLTRRSTREVKKATVDLPKVVVNV